MVKDRMDEFRQKANLENNIKKKTSYEIQDLKMFEEKSGLLKADEEEDLKTFLNQIKDLNDRIARMKENIISIQKFQDDLLESPFEDLNLIKDYNSLVELFKANLYHVNNVLQVLNREINSIVDDGKSIYTRIKKNQIMATNRKFYTLMAKFNEDTVRYSEKSDQIKEKYLEITGINKNYETFEEALEDGKIYDPSTQHFKLYRQKTNACHNYDSNEQINDHEVEILNGIDNSKVVYTQLAQEMLSYQEYNDEEKLLGISKNEKKDFMNDIQSRNKTIIKVESNVRELHDLFIDMAIIVESQGEMLNNIETNISSAVEYTERTHENVKDAKSARDLNIKLKIAIGVSAAILLILLCLIVKFLFCSYFGCAK